MALVCVVWWWCSATKWRCSVWITVSSFLGHGAAVCGAHSPSSGYRGEAGHCLHQPAVVPGSRLKCSVSEGGSKLEPAWAPLLSQSFLDWCLCSAYFQRNLAEMGLFAAIRTDGLLAAASESSHFSSGWRHRICSLLGSHHLCFHGISLERRAAGRAVLRSMVRSGVFSSQGIGLCLPQYCWVNGFMLPCSRLQRLLFLLPFLDFSGDRAIAHLHYTCSSIFPSDLISWLSTSSLMRLVYLPSMLHEAGTKQCITVVVQVHSSGCSIHLLCDHLRQSVCQLWLFSSWHSRTRSWVQVWWTSMGTCMGLYYADSMVITVVSLVVQSIKLCMCKMVYNLDDKNSVT